MPKKIQSLQEVFVEQLKDLYSAETQIIKALPKLAAAATSPELKKGFLLHLEQTKEHAKRIKGICEELKVAPTGKKCEATAGLLTEGQEVIDAPTLPEMKDVMLIGAARRIEHYEIAAYTGACDLARVLGLSATLKTLAATLSEEVATDGILAKVSVPTLARASSAEG